MFGTGCSLVPQAFTVAIRPQMVKILLTGYTDVGALIEALQLRTGLPPSPEPEIYELLG